MLSVREMNKRKAKLTIIIAFKARKLDTSIG